MNNKFDMNGTIHHAGDINCKVCFSGTFKCKCSGFIHSEFHDEYCNGEDESVVVRYQCDKCLKEYFSYDEMMQEVENE